MRKQNKSDMFWRIAISALGAALIVIALTNLLLFFFGESAAASVSTRRRGGAITGLTPSQRYEWILYYTFNDENGAAYSGNTTRRGSDISVKVDSRVYYFTFAPFINALEGDAKPNLIQPIFAVSGFILLYAMNRRKPKKTKGHSTASDPLETKTGE